MATALVLSAAHRERAWWAAITHMTHITHTVLCAVAVRVLHPNWLESQHMLAPARQSKSSESATQERE
jgi:hypothetical protein